MSTQPALPLNAVQRRLFDHLFAIGAPRPTAPEGLAERLEQHIAAGTAAAVAAWTEKTLWVSKSQLQTATRCEGLLAATSAQERTKELHPSTVVGIVAHRAIQIAYTHGGLTVNSYVQAALSAACAQEEDFARFWEAADLGQQSDVLMQATTRVVGFMDSFPPLDPSWTPRFEEGISAKAGKVTLSARPDLTLGRPRAANLQTMMLVDVKTGSLQDYHEDEAMFYALVSTLRHRVPPFRSAVFSLSSGEYTSPDVNESRLFTAAEKLITAVGSICAVLTEQRAPVLTAGTHCTWCPAASTCAAFADLKSS